MLRLQHSMFSFLLRDIKWRILNTGQQLVTHVHVFGGVQPHVRSCYCLHNDFLHLMVLLVKGP